MEDIIENLVCRTRRERELLYVGRQSSMLQGLNLSASSELLGKLAPVPCFNLSICGKHLKCADNNRKYVYSPFKQEDFDLETVTNHYIFRCFPVNIDNVTLNQRTCKYCWNCRAHAFLTLSLCLTGPVG
jgi:hypothetical protein